MPPDSSQTVERLFLSYSHGDRAAAIALRAALDKTRLNVFKGRFAA